MSESTAAGAEAPALEAKVEDAGPCRKKLTVTVPAERVRGELDMAFLELMRSVQVPGFRVGHLPRKVAEMRFGSAVREEVRGQILEKALQEALERNGLVPLGEPDLTPVEAQIDPAKPFSFEVLVEVRPEVKVPDLKGVAVRRPAVMVAEADVDRALEALRRSRAELRPAPVGRVGEGDIVVLDAAVVVGGERVLEAENLQYRHPSEVVAGLSVPEAAKALLGKGTDEDVALKVTLPPAFKIPAHAGKEAELRLTVREVKRLHLPEADAEFARALDFESVEEMRAEVAKSVRREKEAEAERAVDDAVLDACLARAPVELPEGIVKREIGQVLARYQAELHMEGASPEVIEERLAKVQGQAAEQVAREFRVAFLVDEAAKARGILVTEGEVDEQVSLMASRYGRPVEEMRRHLDQRGLLPSIRGRLRERKVLDSLRKDVRVE